MTNSFSNTQTLNKEILFSNTVDALAQAVKESNVKVVYNYPGRPATLLTDKLKSFTEIDVQDYLPNEFVATAKGFGSSVAGAERSLVVFKDVGTNLACDHFYCLNHIGINRGLVFFISDDPSGWHSQNEEDSRGIYFNAGLPFLEPHDPYSAYYSMLIAYELSERYRLPFFIRTTGRLLKEGYNPDKNDYAKITIPFNSNFIDIPFDAKDKWKSIFGTIEKDREELSGKQTNISNLYETLGLNIIKGTGDLGIIASGFPATQLENEKLLDGTSLLKLVTVFPLPEKTIIDFIKNKKRILVVDQGEPLLELLIRDCIQRHGLNTPILGKLNNFVRKIGEFRDDDLEISTRALKENKIPEAFPKHKQLAKAKSFADTDGYRTLLNCLREVVKETGCRPLYCGDAGQPSQIPDTPGYEDMLHMETTMGCSISYLSGGIEAYKRAGLSIPFKGIAYIGDSDFFHSALPGICEAAAKDHPILMLLIDNQGAVSTGKQPHLGMKMNNSVKELSIKKFLQAMDIKFIEEIDVNNRSGLKEKLTKGLMFNKFAALIIHF